MARRSKTRPPASDAPKRDGADAGVFPHQLRAGDVITDEHGVELELLSQPIKVVGAQEFTATRAAVRQASRDPRSPVAGRTNG